MQHCPQSVTTGAIQLRGHEARDSKVEPSTAHLRIIEAHLA